MRGMRCEDLDVGVWKIRTIDRNTEENDVAL
jgi:hypothetical protein